MGKFVISKRANGEFQFNLVASNGQTILTSEGYSNLAGCQNGIDSVKRHAGMDANYEIRQAANGKHYFVLKATNHQVIGTSQMYADNASCMNGITSVMNHVAEAVTENQIA